MGLLKLSKKQLREGRSEKFLYPALEIPQDPDEAYEKAKSLILAAGWKIERRTGKTAHAKKFTMTLRNSIKLAAKWDSYSKPQQAMILWHELVHVRQRKAWGHAKFVFRYASAKGRWAIETPAYRMSVRVYERLSKGKFNATDYVEYKLDSMYKSYWLSSLNKKHYKDKTRAIWLLERV